MRRPPLFKTPHRHHSPDPDFAGLPRSGILESRATPVVPGGLSMRTRAALSFLFLLAVPSAVSAAVSCYVNFESQHVHPIVLSADGSRIFAVNTPDARLSIFDVNSGSPTLAFEIPVGLDPVSVAVRNANEVWVANHLSDTISIVDLVTRNVVATLRVGDEPTDVVFAQGKAFVCVSEEDAVQVYDPANLAQPPIPIPIFGSDPQALAVSKDGLSVYAAVFESGNQTT